MSDSVHLITAIEPQKNRKDRMNIYLDGDFAFGLNQEVVLKHNLHPGDEIEERVIDEVLLAEERARAKEKALFLLSYRPRSIKELKERLKEKGFSERTVKKVIEDFIRVGLLDDRKFVSDYVHSKMIQKPMGKRMLREELFSKGIDEETAERAIDEVYSERSEVDVARDLVHRRAKRYRDDGVKLKKKLSDFLRRRGFDWDVINTVLQEEK